MGPTGHLGTRLSLANAVGKPKHRNQILGQVPFEIDFFWQVGQQRTPAKVAPHRYTTERSHLRWTSGSCRTDRGAGA